MTGKDFGDTRPENDVYRATQCVRTTTNGVALPAVSTEPATEVIE